MPKSGSAILSIWALAGLVAAQRDVHLGNQTRLIVALKRAADALGPPATRHVADVHEEQLGGRLQLGGQLGQQLGVVLLPLPMPWTTLPAGGSNFAPRL